MRKDETEEFQKENADDFRVAKIKKMDTKCEIKSYGIDNLADLIAKDITITNSSVDFKVKIGTRNERMQRKYRNTYKIN